MLSDRTEEVQVMGMEITGFGMQVSACLMQGNEGRPETYGPNYIVTDYH